MANTINSCICGELSAPVNPDQGQLSPYRLVMNGEAPTIPPISPISYDPDEDPKFTQG